MPKNYKEYFQVGQRARVEMSLRGGGTFCDGALVSAVAGEAVSLKLSRDKLPEGAQLDPEARVSVRVGTRGSGYSCRGVVLSRREEDLEVRLVEGMVAEDLREYFRLRAEMPVTLYKVSTGWKDSSVGKGTFPGDGYLPRIIDISGGGIRTETEMELHPGELVHVVFHLPLNEPKMVPVVAEVVRAGVKEDGFRPCFSAGLRYQQINERDRDAVIAFVCNEEIKRLRQSSRKLFKYDD